MEIQQLIEKWTKEMADIKSHIKKHEDTFGHPAAISRERLEAISDMLADIKQLKISCNPMLSEVSPPSEFQDTEADGIVFCGKCGARKRQ